MVPGHKVSPGGAPARNTVEYIYIEVRTPLRVSSFLVPWRRGVISRGLGS